MMLQREICECKINELLDQHNNLMDMFREGKCSVEYMKLNSYKICGEIRGIAYALGKDVELKMGLEE